MFSFIRKIFSGQTSSDLKSLYQSGAVIVDVRTPGEYQSGHIQGSLNIPLNELPHSLDKLNLSRPIITCCASGMRSSTAKSLLKSKGFSEVHNGGSWQSLERSLR